MAQKFPPLESEIRRRITVSGPMSVMQYMTACLTHPSLGYYVANDPFGAAGDFTTAPEISQMFGELIGLWAGSVWRQMGSPQQIALVELGPGRGSMMQDALRAANVIPEFRAAVAVHFVEISPLLEQRQREFLGGLGIPFAWHKALEEVPEGPTIILANEFFDALPVHQAVMCADGWHERVVKLDENEKLRFGIARDPIPLFEQLLPRGIRAQIGEIFEWRADQTALELGRRVKHAEGAALVIDYGHAKSAVGDTLQAVGKHQYADPLVSPGLVDLTAHVDFQALAEAADSMGALAYGPVDQGEFLRRLGIESRAVALKNTAPPSKVVEIERSLARLTGPSGRNMGQLFKVMGFGHPKLGPLPGFEVLNFMHATGMVQAALLAALPGIHHGFFTRAGGVSDGIYASLNGGVGSRDAPARVAENRAHMAAALMVRPERLLTAYQTHSADVVTADVPWSPDARPHADAIVTRTRGLAIGVTTADCGPVLFADAQAGVVGAAHAGWRGALHGVLEATIEAMERCRAERGRMVVALGPMIRQPNYEVGPEFVARFTAAEAANARFFKASARAGHALFDLAGYIAARLRRCGIERIEDIGRCTYGEPAEFFSYRASIHRGEPDYGRHVNGIALSEQP